MRNVILRILVLMLILSSYIASFIFTFLFGSSWFYNSAYTLAIVPAVVAFSMAGIFLISRKYKSGIWWIIDCIAVGFTCCFFALVVMGLLGYFSDTDELSATQLQSGSGFLQSNDASVFYSQSQGSKPNSPTILVLHGGPGSGSYSIRAQFCDSLDKEYHMIYFDQRATGRSSWTDSFILDDYLDDIENLRRTLNVDSWYLFSASWGTVLANEYALRYPDRVKGVINWGGLIAAQSETKEMIRHIVAYYKRNHNTSQAESWNSLLNQDTPYSRFQTFSTVNKVNRLGLKTIYSREDEIERVLTFREKAINEWGYKRSELGANLWVTLATIMQMELEKYDFSPRLREVRQPYLFLAGSNDPQMDLNELTVYTKSMENATVKIVEKSGHLFDNPTAIIKEIRLFICSLETCKNF